MHPAAWRARLGRRLCGPEPRFECEWGREQARLAPAVGRRQSRCSPSYARLGSARPARHAHTLPALPVNTARARLARLWRWRHLDGRQAGPDTCSQLEACHTRLAGNKSSLTERRSE